MGSLFVGTDVIMLKDAIVQVDRNIEELQEKLRTTNHNMCPSEQIQNFYQEKIEAHQITLEWLRKHYQAEDRS